MEKILEINNLNKSFQDFALKDISFSLEPGYIMGFIGPNGAGKSTTIKLIMILLKKDSGEIKIFGKDHVRYEKEIKEDIGFVYDQNHFYDNLSITDMTKILAPFYKKWDQARYLHYIEQFELPKHRLIKEFSKGMVMKYSLAVALSHQARFIIMDEPTAGLDPIIRSELLDILYEIIQDETASILFSTHITKDLDKIADYITFINRGNMVFSRPKDEILESYRVVKGDKNILTGAIRKKLIGLKEHGVGFEAMLATKDWDNSLQERVLIEPPNLEDIMIYTVREDRQNKIDS